MSNNTMLKVNPLEIVIEQINTICERLNIEGGSGG